MKQFNKKKAALVAKIAKSGKSVDDISEVEDIDLEFLGDDNLLYELLAIGSVKGWWEKLPFSEKSMYLNARALNSNGNLQSPDEKKWEDVRKLNASCPTSGVRRKNGRH